MKVPHRKTVSNELRVCVGGVGGGGRGGGGGAGGGGGGGTGGGTGATASFTGTEPSASIMVNIYLFSPCRGLLTHP